jgi:hypothetical protein
MQISQMKNESFAAEKEKRFHNSPAEDALKYQLPIVGGRWWGSARRSSRDRMTRLP